MLFFLIGCSTAPVNQSARYEERLALSQWEINGKLAIQQNKQGASLSFDWQHQGREQYTIQLSGSLGQGASELRVAPGMAILTLDNGESYQGEHPQALVKSVLGWDIPFSSLDYWIRGMPSPESAYTAEHDVYERLVSLTQQRWEITYTHFDAINGMELPTNFRATNGDVVLKVIIKEWNIK